MLDFINSFLVVSLIIVFYNNGKTKKNDNVNMDQASVLVKFKRKSFEAWSLWPWIWNILTRVYMDIQHCWIKQHCWIIFPAKHVLPLSLCWIFVLDFFDVRFRIQHCWIPVVHPLSIQCWIFVLDFFDVRFRICELSQCQCHATKEQFVPTPILIIQNYSSPALF